LTNIPQTKKGDKGLVDLSHPKKALALRTSYYELMKQNKINIFRKQTKTDKQIFLSMISANGLKPTIYSEDMVCGVVTLKDLFKIYG